MEHVAILKKMELFSNLDALEMIQVSKIIRHKRYKPGELVIKEGEEGSSLFIVKNGQFRAFLERQNTSDLAVFSAGDHFGEIALIDRRPRTATIVALTDGEVLEITQDDFNGLLNYSSDLKIKIYDNLIRDLCQKVRRTNDRLLQLL